MNNLTGRFRSSTVYVPGGSGGGGGSWPPATNVYQTGSVDLTIGNQSYAVAFSPSLTGVPSYIGVQVDMKDGNGELFNAVVDLSSVDANGFTFWLNGVPAATGGKVKWVAQV